MKKVLLSVGVLLVFMCMMLGGCGNMDMWDSNYTFDTAIVSWPDGSVKTIEIEQWTDYDGEQIQLIAKDGNIYLINSVNCVLINSANAE